MSFTPYNAPLLSGLLGDMEVAQQFSVKADLHAMIRFEVALARAEAEAGVVPAEAAERIELASRTFSPDILALAQATAQDGMAVPEFVSQLRAAVGSPHNVCVHVGCTSQDLIDTSLVLRVREVNALLVERLEAAMRLLKDLSERFGTRALMAQTRMQAALPVTVADRIDLWLAPLQRCRERFETLTENLYVLQFAGPVGTLDGLDGKGSEVRRRLAEELGLYDPGGSWHTNRAVITDYSNWLSSITSALGKLGQDIVLMAQNERDELVFTGAGTSSAMPHKRNPVQAETLTTIARFNATLVSGMHHASLHEQERSGAAWGLEWMLLPQLCVATAASLRNAERLLGSITSMGHESIGS